MGKRRGREGKIKGGNAREERNSNQGGREIEREEQL